MFLVISSLLFTGVTGSIKLMSKLSFHGSNRLFFRGHGIIECSNRTRSFRAVRVVKILREYWSKLRSHVIEVYSECLFTRFKLYYRSRKRIYFAIPARIFYKSVQIVTIDLSWCGESLWYGRKTLELRRVYQSPILSFSYFLQIIYNFFVRTFDEFGNIGTFK